MVETSIIVLIELRNAIQFYEDSLWTVRLEIEIKFKNLKQDDFGKLSLNYCKLITLKLFKNFTIKYQ